MSVRHSANINYQDSKERTPRFHAVEEFEGLRSIVDVSFVIKMIKSGACIESRNYQGRTPSSYAAKGYSSHSKDTARLLIEHGAEVEDKDMEIRTPLQYAARSTPEILSPQSSGIDINMIKTVLSCGTKPRVYDA